MEVRTKFEGGRKLERALKELGPIPARKLGGKALKAGGEVIADFARVLVPVKTGLLEESIVVVAARASSDRERKAVIGFKRPASRYAHLVEFGTSHSAPQPFIRPAIDTRGDDAIAVIGHQLWAGIAAEAKRLK